MRRSIYISLVLVMLMQSWVGGFWSVRVASAKSSPPQPVQKAPLSCCASAQGQGVGSMSGPVKASPPMIPCKCPDTEKDCCCLRAMAANGGFVFGTNVAPTLQPLRESDHHFEAPGLCSAQVLFTDRETITGTSPPIFKLKACFLI